MTDSLDIPPQLWREVCRHPEIGSAVSKLVPHLRGDLPLRLVLVRRFDVPRRQLETVGEDAREERDLPAHAHSEYTESQFETVLAWCRQNRPLRGAPSHS